MTNRSPLYIYDKASRGVIHILGEIEIFPHYIQSVRNNISIVIFAPNWWNQHFRSDGIWKRAYMQALMNKGADFTVVSDPFKIKPSQKVIWRPSQLLFPKEKRFTSYATNKWVHWAKQIENLGARILPNSDVISYYENKINMHKMFERVGVRAPRSFIVSDEKEYEEAIERLGLPFIVKGPYSYSSLAIDLIRTKDEYIQLGIDLSSEGSARSRSLGVPTFSLPVIIQQFLNIKRDLRVVFIGEKILSSYWRINSSKGWQPTATRFGSGVSFHGFPEQWTEFINKTINKIDFPWGGFDIAWQNDDLSTEPFILEVSPIFDPNPPPTKKYENDYYRFKYGTRIRDNWNFLHWKSIKTVADAQVEYLLNI